MIDDIISLLKKKAYIIIPLSCIIFWAYLALYKDNFTLIPAADFPTYYYCAQLIITNPEKIYFFEIQPYPYTPFFAILFIPMGFLSFEQAHVFFFVVILILSLSCIILFDQILIFKQNINKFHRLLFLLAISNGIIYIQMFDTLGARILTAFGLLWFLKREIKFRVLNKDLLRNKFVFSQMMILMFMFGVTLQYIFLVFLYLFHNVKLKQIFSKIQLKRYFFLISAFIIQNFMLLIIYFISPEAISNFLGGSVRGERSWYVPKNILTYSFLLRVRPRDPVDGITTIIYVFSIYYNLSFIKINIFLMSVLIMTILTIFIHIQKDLNIEIKFGYWALFSLFFYTFTQDRYFVGLIPMIAILFLDYPLKSEKNLIFFIRKNYLQLIGISCIICLYFLPPIHYLIRIFPILMILPLAILYLKYIFVYLILSFDLYLLHKKKQKNNIQIDKIS